MAAERGRVVNPGIGRYLMRTVGWCGAHHAARRRPNVRKFGREMGA